MEIKHTSLISLILIVLFLFICKKGESEPIYDPVISDTVLPKITVTSWNCSVLASTIGTSIRQKTKFNADWKFMLGDNADYKNPTFDDTAWRSLSLPHEWTIEGEYKNENFSDAFGGFLAGGVSWYRKSFTVSDSLKSKRNINLV